VIFVRAIGTHLRHRFARPTPAVNSCSVSNQTAPFNGTGIRRSFTIREEVLSQQE
jgi:hypothetical protein